MTIRLDDVLALPKSGVVIVSGDAGTYVGYTLNVGAELQDIYNLFRGVRGLSLRIVSQVSDIETLKLHTEYYRKLFHEDLGSPKIVEYKRKVIQYAVRVVPEPGLGSVRVELVTARGDSKIVGLFDNIKEANGFVAACYSKKGICYPVYAINKKTREYIEGQFRLFKLK